MKDDINSLAHSKWNCKYHIVFAPKYRRMAIYGQIIVGKLNDSNKSNWRKSKENCR